MPVSQELITSFSGWYYFGPKGEGQMVSEVELHCMVQVLKVVTSLHTQQRRHSCALRHSLLDLLPLGHSLWPFLNLFG